MRALAWHGKHDVRVDTVDDPENINPRDAIIKIAVTVICGSDLHLYDGYIPTMPVLAASVEPQSVPADQHRKMAAPGSRQE